MKKVHKETSHVDRNMGHNKIRRRVSLVFVIGISIALLLNTISLALYMRRTALQNTVDYEMTVMRALSDNIEQMNSTAQSLLLQLFDNSNVRQIISYDSLSDVELLSLCSQLSDYYFQTDYIYTYYLMNTSLERVCTNSGLYSFESFPDTALLEMLAHPESIERFTPIVRRQVPAVGSDSLTNYFTYFQFDAYPSQVSTIRGFIVVNISEEWIQQKISEVCRSDEQVLIFDKDGRLVLSGNTGMALEDGVQAEVYQQLQSHLSSEDFAIRIDGQEYTGLHAPANNGNWSIVRLIPSDNIYAQPNRRALTVAVISLLILAASVTVYLLSSKRVLSPVNALIQEVRQFEIQQARTYSMRKEMLSGLIRQSALKENDPDLVSLFQQYDIHIRLDQALLLCACRIDHYRAFCEQYDGRSRSSLQYAIANVAQDILPPRCQVEYIETEPGTLLLILSDFQDGLQTEPESLQQPIADIQAFIKTHLNFSFSCALSDIGTFSDFKSQYAQVHDLIQQRFFRGESCIILPDDAAQTTDFLPIKSVQQLQQPLLDKLRLQDYAGCEKLILSALEKCREAPVPRIFQLINQINAVIEEYVFTQSESHGEMYLPSTPGDLLKELDYAETYAEVCEGYHHIFAQLSEDDQKERDGGSAYLQLIAEVKKAVDEQYTDPNLSLQSLSERFPFSSVYLGRIFRREVGCSVATYINKVRMEHAAELLRGTHLSVTEIAAACGIENSSYFYTLFKKQFGMTPNEYKRLHPNPPSES